MSRPSEHPGIRLGAGESANRQVEVTGLSEDTLRRALANLHTVEATLERVVLAQHDRGRLGLDPSQTFPQRTLWGRARSRLFAPRSPDVFTRDALLKLSQRGRQASRHTLNVVAVYLSQITLIGAIMISGLIALVTILGKITGRTLFPDLSDGERALVAICTGLFSITLAALLAENRLFRSLREESSSILQLNEMDERYAQLARDGIAYYGAIVKNIRHRPGLGRASSLGEYYRRIASAELNAHREALRRLAQGTYSAPEARVDEMLDSVLDSISTYAAVSHRDTKYWRSQDPDTRKYRGHLDVAARKKKVMRIFVASLSDLRDKWDEYLEVLDDQEATEVRWGIAVQDRFDSSILSLWNSDIAPDLAQVRPGTFDFALVNGGEVATFFTHDHHSGGRHLLATFNVPRRERTVLACASMYTRLLSEVWMCSAPFAADWRRFLPLIMEGGLRREIGPRGTPEKFVRKQDRLWKANRLQRLKEEHRRELVKRMGIDPELVIKHCTPRTAPFEIVRSAQNMLHEDMDIFRKILKADVFAAMRLEEVDALCTPDEARKYRDVARELGIKPTWAG